MIGQTQTPGERPSSFSLAVASSAAACVLAAAFVQWTCLSRDFLTDDYVHLYQVANTGLLEFVLTPYGGHLYIARNLVWSALFATSHINATGYLAFMLTLHLFNTALLFRLLLRLTGTLSLTLLGTGLWAICPVNQGSLGWISALGHVMIGTFFLFFLLDVERTRRSGGRCSLGRVALWYALLLAGSWSYGVGIALAVSAAVPVWLLLHGHPERRRFTAAMTPLVVLVPVLYETLNRLYVATWGTTLGTASLRLALAPRDWLKGLEMFLDLITYGVSSVLLGPWLSIGRVGGVVAGPFQGTSPEAILPMTWAIAVAVAVVCWRCSSAVRRRVLAFLFFALMCYGLIMLGRSSFWQALDYSIAYGAARPRYQYVPQLLIILSVCSALAGARLSIFEGTRSLVVALIILGLLVVPSQRAAERIQTDVDHVARLSFDGVVKEIKLVVEHAKGRPVRFRNRAFEGTGDINRWPGVFPGHAAIFVIAFDDALVNSGTVHFVEEKQWIVDLVHRRPDTRIARVLVGPSGR